MATKAKKPIIFGPIEADGSIIPHHNGAAPSGAPEMRRMKVKFSMPKRDYLKEVKANNTPSTFKTYQSHLNRFDRHLATEGQPDADLEYALSVQTLTRFKYSLSKGIKKDGPLLGQSVRSWGYDTPVAGSTRAQPPSDYLNLT